MINGVTFQIDDFVYLWSPLLVFIIMCHSMNFEAMRLQRTTLSEWLLTEIAFVGTNTWKMESDYWGINSSWWWIIELTCMSASVSFQIKGIIKALATKGAQVSLGITMTLHVPIEEPLQSKVFGAHPTLELARISFWPKWGQLFCHSGRVCITG